MTTIKRCGAQPDAEYIDSTAEVHVTLPCEGGSLRIGVFFDGTGNDMDQDDAFSNVARLARVYRIDRSACEYRWLYVRGPGTNSRVDALGSAFGKGGQHRISGSLYCIQRLIDEFHEVQDSYPSRIVIDVFGFSRGAALARHFVNVIKQGAFDMDAKHRRLGKDAYRIGFLGVFDTVASFGLPGNNVDAGYSFHVAPHWVDDGCLHLVADDEHRANFSLQTIVRGQDLEHPIDTVDGKIREVVLPGAHSDVGGGYASTQMQGQSNNDLARLALERMYCYAAGLGVPLDTSNGPDGESLELKAFWRKDEAARTGLDALMQGYSDAPKIRGLHRRWRTLGIAEEKLVAEVSKGEQELLQSARPLAGQHEIQVRRKKEAIKKVVARRREIEAQMIGCFPRRRDYDEFMRQASEFYGSWVHKSHSPHNKTIGMSAGLHGIDGRRAVFFSSMKDLKTIAGATRATPRAFKNGAWIDKECLEVHRRERS